LAFPCARDARYFIFSQRVEPAEAADLELLRADLLATQHLVGSIYVNETERLQIFEKGVPPAQDGPSPFRYENRLLGPSFDADQTDPTFARHGSRTELQARAAGMNPLDFRFGTPDGPITLRGYSLRPKTVRPGDEVQMTLYWQANKPIETRYAIFNQQYAANRPLATRRSDRGSLSNPHLPRRSAWHLFNLDWPIRPRKRLAPTNLRARRKFDWRCHWD